VVRDVFVAIVYPNIICNSNGEKVPEEEKTKEVDLNDLFPGKSYDLNRLFPDEETRRLLYEVKRNKKDIERFIKNLDKE
jgi:hypothetical protein